MQTINSFLIISFVFILWTIIITFVVFKYVVNVRCSKGIHFWEDSVLMSSGRITRSCRYCGKKKYV